VNVRRSDVDADRDNRSTSAQRQVAALCALVHVGRNRKV